MPRLSKLYREHADLHDHFEILAFHDHTAANFEELDNKLVSINKRWGGPLPFPILLDPSGETVKRFDIRAYPTHVLIDPEGNVVRGGEKRLEEELEKLAKAKPTGRVGN